MYVAAGAWACRTRDGRHVAVRQLDRWTCGLEQDRRGGGGMWTFSYTFVDEGLFWAVDNFDRKQYVRILCVARLPYLSLTTSLMVVFEIMSTPITTPLNVDVDVNVNVDVTLL